MGHSGSYAFMRNVGGPDVRSAVKHQPADIIPQPLVVKYELANRIRKLVTLPSALASPCGLGFAVRRGSRESREWLLWHYGRRKFCDESTRQLSPF
jgi:hypothetical protein